MDSVVAIPSLPHCAGPSGTSDPGEPVDIRRALRL
jgi:hypothetical protein